MDIYRVLGLFDGIGGEGDHYRAKCPNCGKEKHLYITPTTDKNGNDTVKIYCQKCGANAQKIADALGITMAELLHGEKDVKALPTQLHTQAEQREHVYCDLNGEAVAKKSIWRTSGDDKKKCCWYRMEGGQWLKGLSGAEVPLYNLPELIQHPTSSIFVTEGEKDAETLSNLRLLATTLPNGADQKKWPEQYTEAIRGRDIVIITDNDDAGHRYGRFVADHCIDCAKSVKIIPSETILPTLCEKGDITDIVEQIGADGALVALHNALDCAQPEKKPDFPPDAIDIFKELKFYSVPDLTDEDKLPPEFIVDGMIPAGMTFLSGAPKTRKSFLALQLAAAVANGVPFLGHKTTKCKVVYFDLEGSKSRISARVSRMGLDFTRDILITNQIDTKVSSGLENTIRALHKADNACRLFIVDTYGRARGTTRATGANAYDSDIQLLEPVQRMALEENVALVFIHHDKKGASFAQDSFERLSGTMGISGSCDAVLNLICDGKRFDGKATLEFTPRDAKGGELHMNFNELSLEWIIDEAPQDIMGNPLVKWCYNNAPDAGLEGRFWSYGDMFKMAYNVSSPVGGDKVRQTLEKNAQQLYTEFGIGMQLGVKSHGVRGARLFRCF